MYNNISEFKEAWEYESEATLKIFKQLSDDSLDKKFDDNVRTAGRIAWHIVTTIGEMVQKAGLSFDATAEDAPIPETVDEICIEYKRSSEGMLTAVMNEWNDSFEVEVSLYGQKWKREKVLSVLVHHQIHHRGQLTVVMRLAGLKVPGVYGPAKEEWANMGLETRK